MTVRAELAADAPWAPRRARRVAHPVRRRTSRATGAPRPTGAPVGHRCATPSSTRAPAGSAGCSASTSTARGSSCGARPPTTTAGVANDSPDGRSAESRWRERGLDRLVHRVVAVDPDGPVVRVRVGAAGSARTVDVTYRWTSPTRSRCGSRSCPRPTGTAPGRGWASGSTCRRRCGRPAGSAPGRTSRTRTRRAPRGVGRVRRGPRRAERPLLPPAGDRAPAELRDAGDRRRHGRPAPAAHGARPGRPPPRLHPHRAHPAGGGPGPAPARAGRARPARTCSSTTPCTGWARRPAAWTSPRSTACGRARGRSGSCSPRRDRRSRDDGGSAPRHPGTCSTASSPTR